MIDLPVTPLQLLGGNLYAKREDLLPYGGGSKVRRLVPWLSRLPAGARVSCMSDLGSHTFLVLSRLLRSGDFPVSSLCFYERRVPVTPYRAQLRVEYLQDTRIRVHEGASASLLLRSCFSRSHRLGIGGTTGGDGEPHARAFEECARQLEGRGALHVLPCASGETARGFLRAIDRGTPAGHRLLFVTTGPRVTRRRVRRTFRARPEVTVVEPEALPDDPLPSLPPDLPVDPVHGIHALRAAAANRDVEGAVVLWVTSPLFSPPRSAPRPSAPA